MVSNGLYGQPTKVRSPRVLHAPRQAANQNPLVRNFMGSGSRASIRIVSRAVCATWYLDNPDVEACAEKDSAIMRRLVCYLVGRWGKFTDNAPDSWPLFALWALITFVWAGLLMPLVGLLMLKERIYPSLEEKRHRLLIERNRWIEQADRGDGHAYVRECFFHVNNGDQPHSIGFSIEYDEWKSRRLDKERLEAVKRALDGFRKG